MKSVVLLLLLPACTREGEMRALAAQDYACPVELVHVVEQRADIGEPTWEVEACGHRARYTCHDRQRGSNDPGRARGACLRDLEYPSAAKPASTTTESSPPIDEIVRRINAGDAAGLRAMLTAEMQAQIDDAGARKLVADALALGTVRQTSWQGDDALTSLYVLRCEHGELRLSVRMEGAKIAYLAIER